MNSKELAETNQLLHWCFKKKIIFKQIQMYIMKEKIVIDVPIQIKCCNKMNLIISSIALINVSPAQLVRHCQFYNQPISADIRHLSKLRITSKLANMFAEANI